MTTLPANIDAPASNACRAGCSNPQARQARRRPHYRDRAAVDDIHGMVCGPRGKHTEQSWPEWLKREFDWSEDTAANYMQLAKFTASRNFRDDLNLPVSSLYLLAAPSTSDEARAEVIERAEQGERLSVKEVQAIVDKSKPTRKTKAEPKTVGKRATPSEISEINTFLQTHTACGTPVDETEVVTAPPTAPELSSLDAIERIIVVMVAAGKINHSAFGSFIWRLQKLKRTIPVKCRTGINAGKTVVAQRKTDAPPTIPEQPEPTSTTLNWANTGKMSWVASTPTADFKILFYGDMDYCLQTKAPGQR